jgi:hypothetical protein
VGRVGEDIAASLAIGVGYRANDSASI